MKTFLLLLTFLFFSKINSQSAGEAEKNFYRIKNVVSKEQTLEELRNKLDSIRLTFKDKKNNYVDNFLNRSIDFNYYHTRLLVNFDFFQYQVDFITKNDSILLKSIKTEYFKKYFYKDANEKELKKYIDKRNELYNSSKNLKDLQNEISLNETYGMYCGETLSYTKEGYKLKNIAEEKNIKSLKKMLSSFSCEKQAYAVYGFKILSENGVEFPNEYLDLVKHIMQRNSELQICSGCLFGLVEKVY